MLEDLIKINRIRNTNFEPYTKLMERNDNHFVINPSSINKKGDNLVYKKLSSFDLTFTSDYKNEIKLLEKYEELSACKKRFDKVTAMKLKEEPNTINNISTNDSLFNPEQPNSISISFNLSNPRGRPKNKAKDNKKIKECRKGIIQMKHKAEQNQKKVESINTLNYFLSDKPTMKETQSYSNNEGADSKMDFGFMDSVDPNMKTNEIYLSTYRRNQIAENPKVNLGMRKVISLKDLMFYLERNKQTAYHQIVLYKLITKLNG